MQKAVRILSTVFLSIIFPLLISMSALALTESGVKSIDIDAQIHVSKEQGAVLYLNPGVYNARIIGTREGGKFDGFNSNCSSLGCKADGSDCRQGWEHQYSIYTNRSLRVDRTSKYATTQMAIAHRPADLRFELTEPTQVRFYIYNPTSPENNQGGISLKIESL